MIRQPKPPRHLSKEAKTLWRDLSTEYDISDAGGLRILLSACESLDVLRQAEAQIKTDGLTLGDKTAKTLHPAARVAKDARAQMLAALKMLNLDLEPLRDGRGRPGGR